MTTLQIVLTIIGLAIPVVAIVLVAYTVYALRTGRKTISGYLKTAPRLVVFAIGFVTGGIVFGLASHWWWPTVGG